MTSLAFENAFHINLVVAWAWIVLGFVSGCYLGLHFHRENWLGGYASFRRRLYRLGHISFFGLALMNFLFYFTTRLLVAPGVAASLASWAFVAGAVTMPLCCVIMAHRPGTRAIFAVPVVSLIAAGLLTLWEVVGL